MDKSQLKALALDSMNAAGVALKQKNYLEARKFAEKAWNTYFQLQRERGDDEDYTDLIYWARGLYYDAQNNLVAQKKAEQERIEAEKKAAAEARALEIKNEVARLTESLANPDATPAELAQANDRLALMHRQPKYDMLDIDRAIGFAEAAIDNAAKATDLTDQQLFDIYSNALDILLCRDEKAEKAEKVTYSLLDNGFDKDIVYPWLCYCYRHDPERADALENELYEAGTPRGIFLHGQTLLINWLNDQSDDNYEVLSKYNEEVLLPAAEKYTGTPIGNDLIGLAVFIIYPHVGENLLLKEEFLKIEEAAEADSIWANYYLSGIYGSIAETIAQDDPDNYKVDKYRKLALEYDGRAAALGHRSAIKSYLINLENYNGDPVLIDLYTRYAHLLDVSLE